MIEAVGAKKLSFRVAGLGNAVRVEDDLVARLKLLHALLVRPFGHDAERNAARTVECQQGSVLTAFEAWRVVPGAGVGQSSTGRVIDAVESCDEVFVLAGTVLSDGEPFGRIEVKLPFLSLSFRMTHADTKFKRNFGPLKCVAPGSPNHNAGREATGE